MTGPSVAATGDKADAGSWTSAARTAAHTALRVAGEPVETLVPRDTYIAVGRRWIRFESPTTGDVLWAAQVDDAAPPGSWVISTDAGEIGVWRYPHDPALPGLATAVTSDGLTPLLASAGADVDASVVEVVTLDPLQQAVVRIGPPGRAVYVKVVPPWRAERVALHHRRAHDAGLPSPRVLAADVERGLVVMSEMHGATLADHLETGGPLPTATEVWALVEHLATAVGTHGDLHDRQVLVDADGHVTGIVDLDDAGSGDLLDDLARLIAHVVVRTTTHPHESDRIERFVADLSATFGLHVDGDQLRRRVERASRRLAARQQAHKCDHPAVWRRAPDGLVTRHFVLEPLGPQHNDADHRAWTSSIEHIRATAGFRPELWGGDAWPVPMSVDENMNDLVQHAAEFARGEAFAYTVLDPTDGDVIGCVYVDPDDVADARCRLWVCADRAHLDGELVQVVRAWLAGPDWGLTSVRFPGRD